MSGAIMIRCNDSIVVVSDGGLYRSTADFTLTGFVSKPVVMPHISTILVAIGCSTLQWIIQHNAQPAWDSFDDVIENIHHDVKEAIHRVWLLEPGRERIESFLMIGGYSQARERWESYHLMVSIYRSDDEDEVVGQFEASPEVMVMPMADEASLRRYGFEVPSFGIKNFHDDLVRLMLAMRATPQLMGEIGDNADDAETGHTIGGFVEKITLFPSAAISEVLWRWPDHRGCMINPDDEGFPVRLEQRDGDQTA